MLRNVRTFAALVAAGSLLALPLAAHANHGQSHGKAKGHAKTKSQGKSKRCAKTQNVGYVVSGTLVSYTADDATTATDESAVTLTVTGANSHARKSGELADQNATAEGTQVAGGTYTVTGTDDAFTTTLDGYEGADTVSPGDAVHVVGKIARTKKKCAAAGTSQADRYGEPNVRKVTISDRDADTV